METLKHAFPPNIDAACTRLILGSMPSEKSLAEQQYYAHPRNAFWNIMGELLGFERALTPYEQRLEILRCHGIALWDSLAGCVRNGSLDSSIKNAVPNDFKQLLTDFPGIRYIYFNGGSAYTFFDKYCPEDCRTRVVLRVLPSTSPANAVLDYAGKLAKWSVVVL